jgi:predicted RNA-binding Zn-ribbon protein involved in translation (DUF1610 family)
MKVICKQCKSSWTHTENLTSAGINWLGEDTLKWRCPTCGHIVERARPLQFPAANYGPNEDIGDLSRRLPDEYEG